MALRLIEEEQPSDPYFGEGPVTRVALACDQCSGEEARAIIGAFIERYNREWLIERHDHRTPVEARRQLTRQAA